MSKAYRHLANCERCQTWTLNRSGESKVVIATRLSRRLAAIGHEMARNTGWRGYRQAHRPAAGALRHGLATLEQWCQGEDKADPAADRGFEMPAP